MALHLKDRISKLKPKISPGNPTFFATALSFREPAIAQVSRSICDKLENIAPKDPQVSELSDVYDSVIASYRAHRDFRDVPRRFIRLSPWVLFKAIDAERRPLIEFSGINSGLINFIARSKDTRSILNLAHVFLRIYPKDAIYFKRVGEFIGSNLSKLQISRAVRFNEKAKRYHLFEEKGPQEVAAALNKGEGSIDAILDDAGLHGGLRNEGFIEEAFVQWVMIFTTRLASEDYDSYKAGLSRMLDFSLSDGGFRFPQKRINLVQGLLLPFEFKKPQQECKEMLRKFLIDNLGDPRFDIGAWVGIVPAAVTVMRSWLSEIVLEDFFRLLDHSAQFDKDADRQWKYRRAFWAACLRSGLIDEAWFALGKRVVENAPHFLEDKDNIYAEISGSGVQGHHAVLIIQMRNLIITEWTHSGKYRFWEAGTPHCPKLYQQSYTRNEVIDDPDFEGVHHGAPNGTWQQKVADYIREQIGYNLPYSEYMNL